MAHIALPAGLPGIIGPMKQYPETARPLNDLAQVLLVKDSETFNKAERETVASYVSYLNNCIFCSESHMAVANEHWGKSEIIPQVWENFQTAPITTKLKSLLLIAQKIQSDAKSVSSTDVQLALANGATENDVHDTVLIAAAFCMYNRYVDGLKTMTPPRGDHSYREIGKMLATNGYQDSV